MMYIAWLWSFLPTGFLYWIINVIIVLGLTGVAAGYIARWIPFFSTYRGPLQILGVVFLVLGVWMRGGYDTEMAWRAKVEELESKIKVAESKSKQANQDLEKALKDKNKTIKEVQVVIQERIREVEKQIDSECRVDRKAVEILNDSARNQKDSKR
jgi:hypothetical protein